MSDQPATALDLHRWVRDARAGERRGFEALHRHFGPVVRATVLCRVPAADVDDLVQEAFVRGWQALQQLDDPERFGPWICTIARNLCHAQLRRKSVLGLASDPQRLEAGPAAAAAAGHGRRIDAQRALAALRELPPAYAEPLALRLIEGWTGPEIAVRMGMTHGSVRVNLHRGLKLLRERLAAPGRKPAPSVRTPPAGEAQDQGGQP